MSLREADSELGALKCQGNLWVVFGCRSSDGLLSISVLNAEFNDRAGVAILGEPGIWTV